MKSNVILVTLQGYFVPQLYPKTAWGMSLLKTCSYTGHASMRELAQEKTICRLISQNMITHKMAYPFHQKVILLLLLKSELIHRDEGIAIPDCLKPILSLVK